MKTGEGKENVTESLQGVPCGATAWKSNFEHSLSLEANILQPTRQQPGSQHAAVEKAQNAVSSTTTGKTATGDASCQTFTDFHLGQHIRQREYALTQTLNSVLDKQKDDCVMDSEDMLSQRMTIQTAARLWEIYKKDADLRSKMLAIEARIDAGRLTMGNAMIQLADVRLQTLAVKTLRDYHPFWLKLGLELVLGKPLRLFNRRSGQQMEAIIRKHLFSHGQAKRSFPDQSHWDNARNLLLKRILLLVALLDRAALTGDAADGLPLLFRTKAALKSSKEVLAALLKDIINSGACPVKELAAKGYKVDYVQDPRDEYDFHVQNLAIDLRNGLRICKAAMVLTGESTILQRARFPAETRMARLHNVSLAIKALQQKGLQTQVTPAHLVEGSRVQTLEFVWEMLIQLKLPTILATRAVRTEIQRICADAPQMLGSPTPSLLPSLLPSTAKTASDCVDQLLLWAMTITSLRFGQLRDLSESFADGSLFCYLVSFYLPLHIPEGAIKIAHEEQQAIFYLQGNRRFEAHMDSRAPEKYRQAVVHNFGMLQTVTDRIGGIPHMLSVEHFTGESGPDERIVVLYLAYLCARLLDVSREERAAHVIQCAWRKHRAYQPGAIRVRLWRWKTATKVIQRRWRAYKESKRQCATVKIQSAYRRHAARQRLRRAVRAVVCIQSSFRRHMACCKVALLLQRKRQNYSAVQIQRYMRGHSVRRKQALVRNAVTVIQACWRGHKMRRSFLQIRSAVTVIQSFVRMLLVKSAYLKVCRAVRVIQHAVWRHFAQAIQKGRIKAALVIQKNLRRTLATKQLQLLKLQKHRALSASCIQAAYRGMKARRQFLLQRHAAIQIQSAFRGFVARVRFSALLVASRKARAEAVRRSAAITIQSHWRRYSLQCKVNCWHNAARKLQARWRGWRVCRRYLAQRHAAIQIQAIQRGCKAREVWRKKQVAAKCIQAHFRGHTTRKQYSRIRAAAVVQCHVRRFIVRRRFCTQRQAVIIIQAHARSWIQTRRFRALKAAVSVAQKCARAKLARQRYLNVYRAAITIQRQVRGFLVRLDLAGQTLAAVLIQSQWRGVRQRRCYSIMLWERRASAAAICIQRHVRRFQAVVIFQKKKEAAILIQSHRRRILACRRLEARRALREKTVRLLKECAKSMLDFTRRTQAAVKLQRCWRGQKARKTFRAMLTAHHAALEKQRVREDQALAIISSYADLFRDRMTFLRIRKAVSKLQQAWRKSLAKRHRCATILQAHVRKLLARRFLHACIQAATLIQARWRGFFERKRSGKKLRDVRLRVRKASIAARKHPDRTLLALTEIKVQTLLTSRNISERLVAMADLGRFSCWSCKCAETIATVQTIQKALDTLRASTGSADTLNANAYGFLTNIVGRNPAMDLILDPSVISMLLNDLQAQKADKASFAAVGRLLLRLAKDGNGRLSLALNEAGVKHISSVRTILRRKESNERRYLERLQGQKGSDKSAKEATLRMISARKSAAMLEATLTLVDTSWQQHANPDVSRRLSLHPGQLRPRNMLVKEALMSHKKSKPHS